MNILTAVACHFMGDFPAQSDYMALNKGKSYEWMMYHCIVYTGVFVMLGATPVQAAILLGTHFIIDNMKARWNLVKRIWLDQLVHLTVVALLYI